MLVALGAVLGLALAPAGTTAAPPLAPAGPGFLPAAGWNIAVMDSGNGRTTAIAANVPLVDRLSFGSFPRRTLAGLPSRGVVIVASFSPERPAGQASFPARSLPLALDDATVTSERGAVRYRVRATTAGYWIDARVYFGRTPSRRWVALAGEQLARLVVPPITIAARPFYDVETRSHRAHLSGTVSGRSAGESVRVLARECGVRGVAYRSVDRTQTAAGGRWSLVVTREHGFYLPAYFRARWKRALSKQVLVRVPLSRFMELRVGPRLARLTVSSVQRMNGRIVELQRRDSFGRWVTIRRARLKFAGDSSRGFWDPGRAYEASFRIGAGNATLRGYVPPRTAAPCYLPGATDPTEVAKGRITIRSSYGGPQGARQLTLFGKIPTDKAGEEVELYIRGCGPANSSYRLIYPSPQTGADGSWRWLYPDARVSDPVYVRAFWNGVYSQPLLIRTPLRVRARIRNGLLRVGVDTQFTGQRMRARAVELQRRAPGGRWLRVRAAPLRRVAWYRYEATFRVRTRGVTVRAFVPETSARPCYSATATRSFRR